MSTQPTARRAGGALAIALSLVLPGSLLAQPDAPAPGPDTPQPPGQPEQPPVPEPIPPPDVAPAPAPLASEPDEPESNTGTLRLHIISTRNTYVTMDFDIFDVESRAVVAFGKGADESTGQPAPSWDLPPGTYKIVRSGEPFETTVDFATVQLGAGEVLDYVIVVDPENQQFRGSGPVTDELPTGVTIAGVRIALSGGGSLSLTQRSNVVGGTSGVTALAGLYGNFSLVFDRGNHFLSITSDLALNLNDPAIAKVWSTQDRWDAAALYAFNINNPYIGPYVRGSFQTRVFPGHLYLESDDDQVLVNIQRADGTTDSILIGDEANLDDLRIKVANPFSPITLQEEVGANLKAVSIDLLLLKLSVATRLGFGFRQGIMNGLLVPEGDPGEDNPLLLREVETYNTLGPVLGANATVTFARWLFGSAQFGMMVPLKDKEAAGDKFGGRLLMDFSGSAGLKLPALTSFLFASFDYTFRLQKDGFVINDVQFDQTLMARLNVTLF
jgi:hypothetical protein